MLTQRPVKIHALRSWFLQPVVGFLLVSVWLLSLLTLAVFSHAFVDPNLSLFTWSWYIDGQAQLRAWYQINHQAAGQYWWWSVGWLSVWYALLVSYLWLARWKTRRLILVVLLSMAVLLPAYNLLSHDIFNYIFNAKMVLVYAVDPHVRVAQDFSYDAWTRFMHNVHTPAPYGYGWTYASLIPSWLGGDRFALTWVLFRAWSTLALIGLGAASVWAFGKQARFWIVAVMLNPLVLLEIVVNGHNDAWMMGLAVLAAGGVVRATRARSRARVAAWIVFSLLALAASISIKLATIALVPVLVVRMLRTSSFFPPVFQRCITWMSRHWGSFAALAMFVPLLTERSQWFHPWYLLWSLVWLPIIRWQWLRAWLLAFSVASLWRYSPWLSAGLHYSDQSILDQRFTTWIFGILLWLLWLVARALLHAFSQWWKNTTAARRNRDLTIWMILGIGYVLSRAINLSGLPVFADEAIYIRWSQLVLSAPTEYAFFAMNDGKTPLFVWLQAVFLFLISDPLIAGRVLSVLIGSVQVVVLYKIARQLGWESRAGWITAGLVVLLPYWFFHHRMALMDALLVLFLSLFSSALLSAQRSVLTKMSLVKKTLTNSGTQAYLLTLLRVPMHLRAVGMGSLSLGLAFWTKVPAVLWIPASLVLGFALVSPRIVAGMHKKSDAHSQFSSFVSVGMLLLREWGVTVAGGIAFFTLLKLTPLFSQLFARGSDFLYPLPEILAGQWWQNLMSAGSYVDIFATYLTPVGVSLALVPLVMRGRRWQAVVLWMAALVFLAPIVLFGKVVYARYLLPAAVPLTLLAALGISVILERLRSLSTLSWQRVALSAAAALFLAQLVTASIAFMMPAWTNPDQMMLTQADRVQYLTEWSSGHGIREVLIDLKALQTPAQPRILVATEGFFGTLPDALNMYLFAERNNSIAVEGVGFPVLSIPDLFWERSKEFDQVYLVVNDHRRGISLPESDLVNTYCRPDNAPCLELWRLSLADKD